MTATAFHCELAWLGGEHAAANVLVEGIDGRITRVRQGVPAPSQAVRLSGLTLPGIANAHSHAFHRALRGRAQRGTGSFWTWREEMYELAEKLEPQTYYKLARATFAEMALAGITCVGEFHYVHHDRNGRPYKDPNEMGAVLVAAAESAGIRITLLDTCYLRGGFGEPPTDVQLRFSDGDAYRWARRVDALAGLASSSVRIGAAFHSVRAVDTDSIEMVVEWTRRNRAPLHGHLSEQKAENEQCIAANAISPAQLVARCGVLDENFTAVHATWLSAHDIGLIGKAGCNVCFCPTTERDLADGIGPSLALRKAGSRLVLGSDSHAMLDMLEEARALEMNERLVSNLRGNHPTTSLLSAATENGHRSLGWTDAGRIAVGQLADMVSIRLDTVRTTGGGDEHALERALFAASAADVNTVVVGGRVVVNDGRHCSIDVPAELASSIQALA